MLDFPLLAAGLVVVILVTVLLLSLGRRRRAAAAAPAAAGPRAFHQIMEPGSTYEVMRAFTDFDGRERLVGERWVFRGYNFLPYEDGLTLITDPGPSVRLQWRPETQGEIIDSLADYIAPV